ncbi:MAG: hypothetical protein M3008_09575 [Chloroflexota bacterium]|nr:hypothetical protein [Chloroflexota bacterium]
MAENVTEMRVEGTMIVDAGTERNRARMPQTGVYGLVTALLVALLIGGVVVRDQRATHPATPAISRVVTSEQTRFLENNTTNLPNAVTADIRPVVTSAQQKYLDVNTTWMPDSAATDVALSAMTSSQQRFLEVNTVMLPAVPSYPYAEDLTPLPGHRR